MPPTSTSPRRSGRRSIDAGVGAGSATRPSTPLRCWRSATSRLDVDGVRRLDDVSISVAPGEIVGVAGVSGNGQTELVDVLCATTAPTSGTIHVDGVDVTAADPVGRIRAGLGRITEDRRGSVDPRADRRAEPRARGPRPLPALRVHPAQPGPSACPAADRRLRHPRRAARQPSPGSPAATCRRSCSPGRCPAIPERSSPPSRPVASTSAPTPTSTTSCAGCATPAAVSC